MRKDKRDPSGKMKPLKEGENRVEMPEGNRALTAMRSDVMEGAHRAGKGGWPGKIVAMPRPRTRERSVPFAREITVEYGEKETKRRRSLSKRAEAPLSASITGVREVEGADAGVPTPKKNGGNAPGA